MFFIYGLILLLSSINVFGDTKVDNDTIDKRKFIHAFSGEFRSDYLFSTKELFKNYYGYNQVKWFNSTHFKYKIGYSSKSIVNSVYGNPYQGIGVGYFFTGAPDYVGNPMAIYVFQGGRIGRLTRTLSLNYEWNFGVSGGWVPYDVVTNPINTTVGSKLNAYINGNINLNLCLSPLCDVFIGTNITHFSNGNTNLPNAGVNMVGGKIGFTHRINKTDNEIHKDFERIPSFRKHFSYELILFASQRKTGVDYMGTMIPASGKYNVGGVNFTVFRNINYKFRAGVSVDGIYNASANLKALDFIVGTEQQFEQAPLKHQFGMGVSVRGEYVMPVFTVGLGLGRHVVGEGEAFSCNYQIFSLKMNVTRHFLLHVGYNLKDFKEPNYLMLGLGFVFNNKYPRL
ncbi:MAG: acyloxyacyl hydrolase [Marinifilaceae bacterium]